MRACRRSSLGWSSACFAPQFLIPSSPPVPACPWLCPSPACCPQSCCPHSPAHAGAFSLPKALVEAGVAFCLNTQWLTPGYPPFFPGPLVVLSCRRRRACSRLKRCLMSARYSVLTETLTGQTVFLKCSFFSLFARSPWTFSPPAAPLAFISFESSKQILSLHLLHLWE